MLCSTTVILLVRSGRGKGSPATRDTLDVARTQVKWPEFSRHVKYVSVSSVGEELVEWSVYIQCVTICGQFGFEKLLNVLQGMGIS